MTINNNSPPGDTIRDIMEERGISRRKLRCMLDLSDACVIGLLDGTMPIDNDLATKLSEKLGSTVTFWENREKNYREFLALPDECRECGCNCSKTERAICLAEMNGE